MVELGRSKSWGMLLLSVLFAVGLTACGGGGGATADQAAAPSVNAEGANVAAGQALFAANCAACHGPAGEGVQGLGKDMTDSPFMDGLTDEELAAFLAEGRSPTDPLNTTGILMPPKGGNPALTDAQLMDIVAFLRSIHR